MNSTEATFWALLIGGAVVGVASLRGNVEVAGGGKRKPQPEPGRRPATSPKPGRRPATPQPEPGRRPAKGQRLTSSSTDSNNTVREAPAELLAEARRRVPSVTLDEYTAARLAASEYGSGRPVELAAVIDATVNAAARQGRSLFAHLTKGARGTFGKQGSDGRGGKRPASTRQDPREIHLAAAFAVLRSGELRGVSRDARRYFSPRTQFALWNRGDVNHCDPLTLLRRWAFAFPQVRSNGRRVRPLDAKGRALCQLDDSRSRSGRNTFAWVGPVDGIDATRLMLMAPTQLGADHTQRYNAARAVIERVAAGRIPVA